MKQAIALVLVTAVLLLGAVPASAAPVDEDLAPAAIPAGIYYGNDWLYCVGDSVAFLGGLTITVFAPPASAVMWVAVGGLTTYELVRVGQQCGLWDAITNPSGTYLYQYKLRPATPGCRWLPGVNIGVSC